eukprot:UN23408
MQQRFQQTMKYRNRNSAQPDEVSSTSTNITNNASVSRSSQQSIEKRDSLRSDQSRSTPEILKDIAHEFGECLKFEGKTVVELFNSCKNEKNSAVSVLSLQKKMKSYNLDFSEDKIRDFIRRFDKNGNDCLHLIEWEGLCMELLGREYIDKMNARAAGCGDNLDMDENIKQNLAKFAKHCSMLIIH